MADSETSAQRGWWPWLAPWTMPGDAAVPWFGLAPQRLDQPINPGWSFGNLISVTNMNSTAPQVEQEIVARHSYGRQIGRMMDALAAVVEALPASKRADDRIGPFLDVVRDVDTIKRQAKLSRAERLKEELEQLRRDDPRAWRELAALFTGR